MDPRGRPGEANRDTFRESVNVALAKARNRPPIINRRSCVGDIEAVKYFPVCLDNSPDPSFDALFVLLAPAGLKSGMKDPGVWGQSLSSL